MIGDTNQLPHVAKTAVYSGDKTPAAGTSDALGQVVFHDFLNPPDETEVVAESMSM